MKQQIISEINSKLSQQGIPIQKANGADITISTEFLDAGWSTGSKKISYYASVFANEQDNIIYMYEKTTEVGNGLSFGAENSTSFQSGKTLFRKVKSVQYGPDGKAYEYTLDLGAIPKAVKDTAKQYGWKFKTVLNKNKAMYPAGYVLETSTPITEQDAPQVKTQSPSFSAGYTPRTNRSASEKVSIVKSIVFWVFWSVLLILSLIMVLAEFSLLQASLYVLLLGLLMIFRRRILSRWIITIAVWIITFIIFMIGVGLTI